VRRDVPALEFEQVRATIVVLVGSQRFCPNTEAVAQFVDQFLCGRRLSW
jgi:hypothetical protein